MSGPRSHRGWDDDEAATRLLEGLSPVADDREPLVYIPRLITFGLIILAIVQKNRPSQGGK